MSTQPKKPIDIQKKIEPHKTIDQNRKVIFYIGDDPETTYLNFSKTLSGIQTTHPTSKTISTTISTTNNNEMDSYINYIKKYYLQMQIQMQK